MAAAIMVPVLGSTASALPRPQGGRNFGVGVAFNVGDRQSDRDQDRDRDEDRDRDRDEDRDRDRAGDRFDNDDRFDERRFEPRIFRVDVRNDGRFIIVIRGRNFDSRARVAIFGRSVPSNFVRVVSREEIVVNLSFFRNRFSRSGFSVTVINRNGRADRAFVRF